MQAEDKQMLIQSMKKLCFHISNNSKRQIDIFNSLSLPDLQKIVTNLHDANEDLRKVSALLLCQMAFKSDQVKKKMVNMLKIYPPNGRICLGGFNSEISKYPFLIKNCLAMMKSAIAREQQENICWFINIDRNDIKLQFMQYKKYASEQFLDPKKTIFGMILSQSKNYNYILHSQSPLNDKMKYSLTIPAKKSLYPQQFSPYNHTQKIVKTLRMESAKAGQAKKQMNMTATIYRPKNVYQVTPPKWSRQYHMK